MPTLADVVGAAREFVASGIETVVVTLGRYGAVLVTGGEVVHAIATVEAPLSTVGAGDCLLAGVLQALDAGRTAAEALATGVAWGAAAVALPGSRVPSPADVSQVHVTVDASPGSRMLGSRRPGLDR